MNDREVTRLLQTNPEEGLKAAMLAYAPTVKVYDWDTETLLTTFTVTLP